MFNEGKANYDFQSSSIRCDAISLSVERIGNVTQKIDVNQVAKLIKDNQD
jgi:hypothetical protein